MYSELVHFGKLTPPQRGRIPEMTMQVFKKLHQREKGSRRWEKKCLTSQRPPTPPNAPQHLPTPPNTSQHLPTPPNTQLIQVVNLDFEEKKFWGGSGHPSHPSYQKISAPKDTKAQPPLVRSNSLLAFGLSVLQRPGAQRTARDKKEKSSVPCACGASLQPTLPMT